MARYSKNNPAPKRCATCVHCIGDRCVVPIPAWARDVLTSADLENENFTEPNDHRDPKCPLWQARGPTTH